MLTYEHQGLPAIAIRQLPGGEGLRLKNLTIENTQTNVLMATDSLTVEGCLLRGSKQALIGHGATGFSDILVRDCDLEDAIWNPAALDFYVGSERVLVENCRFKNVGRAVLASGATDVAIEGCTIATIGDGITYFGGSTGSISNCSLLGVDTASAGVVLQFGSHVELVSTEIVGFSAGVRVGNSIFEATGLHLLDQADTAIYAVGGPDTRVSISNSRFRGPGELLANIGVNGPDDLVDLRNNDWGTNDLTEIWELIYSGEDFADQLPGYANPLVEPILTVVPTAPSSMGSTKASFGKN